MTQFLSMAPVPATALFRRAEVQPAGAPSYIRLASGRPLEGLGILHLGFSRSDGHLIGDTLRRLGARNIARSDHVYPLGLGKPGALRYDGVVVNLDRYADLEMGVDRLMRFRRACPSCFVVMATTDMASDDVGHRRRAICDGTLRLPLSASRLADELEAAVLHQRSFAA